MTIHPGSRLGPYEIVAQVGAGGMGEVWRAKDTRLDRSVAIKVLPAEFANNAQLKLRFEREAKTISQLNHPNICTLYDVGDDYIVMELLEGETLAERIAKAPLPIEQVLKFGVQITDALDKAHRAGIVHRDLKPANVMLTTHGAKLLDFGLAKTAVHVVDFDGPTMHRPLTQEGTILGTFQYMAPEQLEGEEADARTDIFALGTLLYEMATGHRAFEGKTKTSLIASIVSAEPRPIRELQPLTPPAFEHVVQKCLSKQRDDRWQSAHDVAEELRWIGEGGSSAAAIQLPKNARRRWRTAGMVLAIATLAAGVAAIATYYALESKRTPLRLTINIPENVSIADVESGGAVAIAPDGHSVLFVGRDDAGTMQVWIRSLDSFGPRRIRFTEGASYPFWSPDGRSIGFFSGGKLKRVNLSGAPPVVIADAPDGRGGAWSKTGTILYAPTTRSNLLAVDASGAARRVITRPAGDDVSYRFPSFFPDGDHFICFEVGTSPVQGIWIGSLSSGLTKRLLEARTAGIVAGDDEILYIRDGVLLEQRVDTRKSTTIGESVPVAENVSSDTDRDYQLLSATASTVIFQTGGVSLSLLTWFDRSGKNVGSVGTADEFVEPGFTAHDTKVVVTVRGDLREIDLVSGRMGQLTFSKGEYATAAAAPDGSRVISYVSVAGKISIAELVGSHPPRIVAQFKKAKWPDYFDASGDILLMDGEREDERGDYDIFIARRSATISWNHSS